MALLIRPKAQANYPKQALPKFRNAMICNFLLTMFFAMFMSACSSSKVQSKSTQSTQLTEASATTSTDKKTDGLSTPKTTSAQNTTGSTSPIIQPQGSSPSNTTPSGTQFENQIQTVTTLAQQVTVPPTIPRFVSFQCSITIRETSQQPSPNTVAMRVDVTVTEQSVLTVWVEALSGNQRDRKALAISKSGTASTQLVVLEGKDAIVTVYAAPDFEPDARMCSAKR